MSTGYDDHVAYDAHILYDGGVIAPVTTPQPVMSWIDENVGGALVPDPFFAGSEPLMYWPNDGNVLDKLRAQMDERYWGQLQKALQKSNNDFLLLMAMIELES